MIQGYLRLAWLLVFGALLSSPALAVVSIGFDDDVVANFAEYVHPDGVTFTVDPAGFASYGTGFAIGAEFVQGPSLQLDPGATLTIAFDVPVSYLVFGVLGTASDALDRATVALYTPDDLPGLPFVYEPAFSGLSERQFQYIGDGVNRVEVAFATSFDSFDPLAIDNLVFQPVPEPSTYLLLAGGLLCLVLVLRRRRLVAPA